jgi:hypothetical protein
MNAAPFPLRYPPSSLAGDYARAALGLALTLAPLAAFEVTPWIAVPMTGAAGLFTAFGVRTLARQMTRVMVDDEGVTTRGPLGGHVRWDQLRGLTLHYYSSRRDGRDGRMQLTLAGPRSHVTLDSTLDGFDAIVEHAAATARRNAVELDATTVDNLLALGIDAEAGVG